MFYTSDIPLWTLLFSIKKGLSKKFDMVLVIAGDTGTGKSHFGMQLIETWQKVLGRDFDPSLIERINVDKEKWLKKFKELDRYDANLFDEGAAGLGSKQSLEKFGKTLEMLFQVIRYKGYFTIIIVPNFFRLNKFFREDRLRGLFYIHKRGKYKYYSRDRVVTLCQKNSRLYVKNMSLVAPLFTGKFPEYKGRLLDAYEDMKDEGVQKILDEVIAMNSDKAKDAEVEKFTEKKNNCIRKLYATGKFANRKLIAAEAERKLGVPISDSYVTSILNTSLPKDFSKLKVNKS